MGALTKVQLRRRLLQERAALPEEERACCHAQMVRQLLASSLYRQAERIFTFLPTRQEVDLWPFLRQALADGKALAAPVCLPGRQMAFYPVEDLAALHPGAYGIMEPVRTRPVQPDEETLCLVPGLCFDPGGGRIGYGGGYYDRFLAGFPGRTVGIAEQISEQLPSGPWDVPVAYLLTRTGILAVESETEGTKASGGKHGA